MSNDIQRAGSYGETVDTTNSVVFDTAAAPTETRKLIKVPADSGTDRWVLMLNWKLTNNEGAAVDVTLEQSYDDQVSWFDILPATFPMGVKEQLESEMSGQAVLQSTDAVKLTTTGAVEFTCTWQVVKYTRD